MTGTESEGLDDLPPSAKYVLDKIEDEEPITRQDLLAETNLPERTLDRALSRLQNGDYIVKTQENDDLRRVVARTAPARRYNPSRD